MTSKPSTTNCPKLSSGLPPPEFGVRGPVTQTLSCVFFLKGEKFYHVLLVEIRHLIRLTAISREIKCCLLENENLRDIRKVYVTLSKVIRKKYQVVIAAGSHLFPFRTEKLSPFAPMVLQCNAGE